MRALRFGFGVAAGLGLVLLTGWTLLEPLGAVAVAINILWSGGKLTLRAITGLMDYADPALTRTVNERLAAAALDLGFEYHAVRIRNTGNRIIIDLHLLFPFQTLIGDARRKSTDLEQRLPPHWRCPARWSRNCRIHKTLRVTPAMEANLTDHVWDMEELLA